MVQRASRSGLGQGETNPPVCAIDHSSLWVDPSDQDEIDKPRGDWFQGWRLSGGLGVNLKHESLATDALQTTGETEDPSGLKRESGVRHGRRALEKCLWIHF